MLADFAANVFADVSNLGIHFIHPLTKHDHSCACLICSAHDKDPNKQFTSTFASVIPLATPSDLDLLKTGSKSIRQLVILSSSNHKFIGDIPLQQFCMELKTHLNFSVSFGLPKINPNTPYHVLVLIVYNDEQHNNANTQSWFSKVIARHTKRAVVICPSNISNSFLQNESSKITILAYDDLALTLQGLTHGMMVTKQRLMPKDLNRFMVHGSQTITSHMPQPEINLKKNKKPMSNFQLLFGNKDVTKFLKTDETKFIVNIQKFSDPQRNVFKYLHIVDSSKNCTVIVSENDVVEDLNSVFEIVPLSKRLKSIQSYIQGDGISLVEDSTLQNLNLCAPVPRNCKENDVNLHFFIAPIKTSTMLKDLLFKCKQTLSQSGHGIFLVSNACFQDVKIALKQENFQIVYLQRDANVHIIIAKKTLVIMQDELDTKHQECDDNDDKKQQLEMTMKALKDLGYKMCPFCGIAQDKNKGCDFLYCGLGDKFHVGLGCGRSFCWQCGLKYCGFHYNPQTGEQLPSYKSKHDAICCTQEAGFVQSEYCPGGHSSHASVRW